MVVKKHEPVQLNCKADGNPPPIIEWYKDNVKVEPSPSSNPMILGDSLFFLHVSGGRKGDHHHNGDTGTYYCLARNEVGKAISRNATLEIALLKDEFRVLPINTQVAQGKTVIMQCSPPKGRPEPNVHWLHDGQKIYMDSGRFRLDGTNLVINDVMKDDQGQYQCIAKNMIGVRESPAVTLKVLVEPYFIRPPDSIKTMAGTDIIFHCQVGGDPKPEISWHKIEGDIAIDKSQILEDKALKIHQVKISDAGTYVCDAENAAGKLTKSATLIVNSHPTLITNPKTIQALVNDVVHIECMANGNPEPLYFWHKESAHLLMFPGHQYGKYNVSNDGRLTITNLARQDQGYYLCSAISTVGSTMSRTYLKILDRNDVPPPRIRLGATNQTLPLDTKAFLPCEATSSLSVISNMIDADPITTQWLYNQIPIHNDSRFQITRTGLHIQNIQRIDSGIYTCLATSQLTGSSTSWTARLSVESPRNPNINFSKMPHPTMFPEAPTKPSIVNVTETSITLRWQRSTSISNSGSSAATHLGTTIEAYSPDFRNQGWFSVANRIVADIFTVKNLRPNTRYIFYVRAQNIHGMGLPSDVSDEVHTTDHQKLSSSPMNEEMIIAQARTILNNIQIKLRDARSISSTSIKLFWNVVGNGDFIDGYYIRFENIDNINDQLSSSSSVNGAKFNMVTVFGGSTYTYNIQDLNKYTTYRFFVMPFFRNVEGRPSNIVIERTYEDRPSAPPYSITAKVINSTSAIVEWLPPIDQNRNGIILGYYLQIFENNSYLYANLSLDSTFNSIALHNLTIGSIYSIQMSAFTSIGNGPLSLPIYLSMDGDNSYNGQIGYNGSSDSENNQNEYLLSPIFWAYVIAILMAIILFILAVRLVLFYSNRKNSVKSIYEKADENFSENFAKYDTSNSSSKYSSCPDNNEYAEVNDFKHYGQPLQQQQQKHQHGDDNINAEPYAMTPLIEKSINKQQQQQHYDNITSFKPKQTNNLINNDSFSESPLLNTNHHNHHHLTTTDMIHPLNGRQPVLVTHLNGNGKCQTSFQKMIMMTTMNDHHHHHHQSSTQPLSSSSRTTNVGFNMFNTDFDATSNIRTNKFTDNNNDDDNDDDDNGGVDNDQRIQFVHEIQKQKQQNSLPSGRSIPFLYRNDLDSLPIGYSRNDGRNQLMTFNQPPSSHHSPINNGHILSSSVARIINNPISSSYDSGSDCSSSNANNNNKNYNSNHYYASSEIIGNGGGGGLQSTTLNDSTSSHSSSLASKTTGPLLYNCDNQYDPHYHHQQQQQQQQHANDSNMNNIHDQMAKNRIHNKKRNKRKTTIRNE
ncbi:roundabout homolog 2 isoform X2 [Dermatophagoides farinae]